MLKAMILAAGMGTRLMPYTARQPKALVPLAGKPLIEHVLDRFRKINIKDVVINLHHHADQLYSFLCSGRFNDFRFSFSDESDQLLDTGGGIKRAARFFNDSKSVLVHNCDVISKIPLDEMLRYHYQHNAIATLAVSKRNTARPLAFSTEGLLLRRWKKDTETGTVPMAFSGIYIIDHAIFSFMPGHNVFSIIDVLISAAKYSPVVAYEHQPDSCVDAGSIENFEKAKQLLENINK